MPISIVLIILGIVCILWGAEDLKVKEGIILNTFSWPKGSAKWLKWPIGVGLIYTGIRLILRP